MPRTSTSFKPGQKGMGGRPKGARNGSSDAWRRTAKSAADVGNRADELQSGIMVGTKSSQRNYPSPPVLTKRNRLGEQPDTGARNAAKKALELEREQAKVQEELSNPDAASRKKVAELTDAIAALDELSKAEKVFLGQSGDPRPLIIQRPSSRIRFLHPPIDPLRPDDMGPIPIFGGLTGAEFSGGKDKYRAALEEARKRDVEVSRGSGRTRTSRTAAPRWTPP